MQKETTTKVVKRLLAGDESAADDLNDRFSHRLNAYVEPQIGSDLQIRIDPLEVVNSAIHTFVKELKDGMITIDKSKATWMCLIAIAGNKLSQRVEFHTALKRDPKREVPLGALAQDLADNREPSAEERAQAAEWLEWLEQQLDPQGLTILTLRIDGHAIDDIATKLDCTLWSVRRTMDRIRRLSTQYFDNK